MFCVLEDQWELELARPVEQYRRTPRNKPRVELALAPRKAPRDHTDEKERHLRGKCHTKFCDSQLKKRGLAECVTFKVVFLGDIYNDYRTEYLLMVCRSLWSGIIGDISIQFLHGASAALC